MIISEIILTIVIIFLFFRMYFLKIEIQKMNTQLESFTQRKTNKKLDMALIDDSLEKLGIEINRLIDLYTLENRKRVCFEKEHQQAVANMSHDLRTPLTSIIGYIQMAENEVISEEEKRELLSVAKARAKRLEALLHDFFEMSVIDASDYQLKTEKIQLSKLLTEVLFSFYDQFEERGLKPTIQELPKSLYISGDESAVTRVLENVISNAIKYADGNIVIKLVEHEHVVKLKIKNDALSLSEQDVSHMFDRFYMADKSRTGKSTGLGLSIVKSLMEKMNGKISGHLQSGQLVIVCEWKK